MTATATLTARTNGFLGVMTATFTLGEDGAITVVHGDSAESRPVTRDGTRPVILDAATPEEARAALAGFVGQCLCWEVTS
jgi:hypothetical protein